MYIVVPELYTLGPLQQTLKNFGMLTLAIGDFFIPDRVIELPPKFCKLLAPNAPSFPSNPKISQVLCLGNITQSASTLRFLHNLSPSFHIVRGEFDNFNILSQQLTHLGHKTDSPLPFYKVVTADNFRIGITSGYQDVPRHDPLLLLTFAREIDVDILISGGAHHIEAYTLDGKFFINPGSATGSFGFSWPEIDERDDDDEEEEEERAAEGNKEIEQANFDSSDSSDVHEAQDGLEGAGTNSSLPSGDNDTEATDELSNDPDTKESKEDIDLLEEERTPSFCLLDTLGSQCTLYIYTQVNGEVKVDKVMYLKEHS